MSYLKNIMMYGRHSSRSLLDVVYGEPSKVIIHMRQHNFIDLATSSERTNERTQNISLAYDSALKSIPTQNKK
jgi:hypothetical protein